MKDPDYDVDNDDSYDDKSMNIFLLIVVIIALIIKFY